MRMIVLLWLIACGQTLCAQTSFQKDLTLLRDALTNRTMSFRGQMKGQKLTDWNRRFDAVYQDTSLTDPTEQFFALAALLYPVQDGHLGLYQRPLSSPRPAYLSERYGAGAPRHYGFIYGRYRYAGMAWVDVVPVNDSTFEAAVADPGFSTLVYGQTVARWTLVNGGQWRALYYHPLQRIWLYYSAERWENGVFLYSQLYGLPGNRLVIREDRLKEKNNAEQATPVTPGGFVFRDTGKGWHYLALPHFNGFTKEKKRAAQSFADSIQPLLTGRHLIVDLRHNTGGSSEASGPFYHLIKRFTDSGRKVHVLIDAYTLSQGELFTLKLQKLQGTKLYGQTTKGMLAYGNNGGTTVLLPDSGIVFYPTDLWSGMEAMRLEGKGIEPEVKLKEEKDWVKEVRRMVK